LRRTPREPVYRSPELPAPREVASPRPDLPRRLATGALAAPGIVWLLAFFLAPVLIIFVVSFGTNDSTGHITLANPGLQNYAEATKPEFIPAFLNSVRYSLLTTIFSIGIGYPIAYSISRHARPHQAPLP